MTNTAMALPPLEESTQDDPRVVRRAATEDYAAHVVPKSARSSRWSMAMAWYALASAMAWLITAGVAAVAVGPLNALVGAGLSVIAYSVFCAAMANYAARTGTSINLFSRMLFGLRGGSIATLVLFLIATFYATFEGSVVAHAFDLTTDGPPLWFWYLVVVAYSVPLAIGGVRAFLDKFNGFLLPVYIIGMAVAVVWTVADKGYQADWLRAGGGTADVAGPGWLYSFTLYMGVWVLMMFTGDMARHARVEDMRFHRWFTFGPVFHGLTLFVNALVGIFLAEHLVQGQLTELSAVDGMIALMGGWAVVFIWVTQTRINTANYYVASSNFANLAGRLVRRSIPRWFWVVAVGVIVYVLMLQNVISKLQIALEYSAIITVAWVGVVLAYMLWAKVMGISPEHVEYRPGRVPPVNWPGVVAWTTGTVAGVVLLNLGNSFGSTWNAPATFLISFFVYLGALLVARSGHVLSRPHDPRGEVADAWESRIRCHTCGLSYVAQEMDRDPSTGHHPICCECAAASPSFLAAARHEAIRSTRGRTTVKCQLAIRVFAHFLNRTPQLRDMLDRWDRTFEFRLEGERPFHLVFENGRARVAGEPARNPDVVFEAPAALFLRMMLDPALADQAYVNKKYEVHGPPPDATRFRVLGERVQDHHPRFFGVLKKSAKIVLAR
ncbi:SCP2 sterol-binding domain-containing protein [Lentzea sp. NPDC058436]|uniref:SCP2 sterol-binding domain-containing protein n=1 Tax=Lentzea sp. NPDC058436 TaxID=3346499 RepID=UPI0036609943